jgi:uncharacterized membrane protein
MKELAITSLIVFLIAVVISGAFYFFTSSTDVALGVFSFIFAFGMAGCLLNIFVWRN